MKENEELMERPRCLSNTISVGFKGIGGSRLVYELRELVAVSAGSACHSSVPTMLPVLKSDLIINSLIFILG